MTLYDQLVSIIGTPPAGAEKYAYIGCVLIVLLTLYGFMTIAKMFLSRW